MMTRGKPRSSQPPEENLGKKPPKKRGRPPKKKEQVSAKQAPQRRPGRPKKTDAPLHIAENANAAAATNIEGTSGVHRRTRIQAPQLAGLLECIKPVPGRKVLHVMPPPTGACRAQARENSSSDSNTKSHAA